MSTNCSRANGAESPSSMRQQKQLLPLLQSPSPATQSPASAALDKVDASSRHPVCSSYPPASSTPITTSDRLSRASQDARHDPDHPGPDSVLYLAYGSNLCAETFLGVRGIRPLSQVNVSVPTLRLTFDLPGIPYSEPCFANVGFLQPAASTQCPAAPPPDKGGWDGHLMGVVYEVTQQDYRTIMRTEGAGASYQELVVSCIPIRDSNAPHSTSSSGAQPFLARTLYAAYASDQNLYPERRCRLSRLFAGSQLREPGYAQPSARYLKLIRNGAREHDLPPVYQSYLSSLRPFIFTSWRQRVGKYLLLGIWGLPLMAIFKITSFLADETGKLPSWLAGAVTMLFNMMWASYDAFFNPLFGDGERTQGQDVPADGDDGGEGVDDEKASLLQNEPGLAVND